MWTLKYFGQRILTWSFSWKQKSISIKYSATATAPHHTTLHVTWTVLLRSLESNECLTAEPDPYRARLGWAGSDQLNISTNEKLPGDRIGQYIKLNFSTHRTRTEFIKTSEGGSDPFQLQESSNKSALLTSASSPHLSDEYWKNHWPSQDG